MGPIRSRPRTGVELIWSEDLLVQPVWTVSATSAAITEIDHRAALETLIRQ